MKLAVPKKERLNSTRLGATSAPLLAALAVLVLGTFAVPSDSQLRTGRTADTSPAGRVVLAEAPNDLARALHAIPSGKQARGRDLALARSVGAPPRAIVVDIGSARLWMLEHGAVAGSMKVVVGKPSMNTPELVGQLSYATLNPYWNVPPDLVRNKFAPRIVRAGPRYLSEHGYQAVDRYGLDAKPLDPRTVNWADVAAGKRKVGIRQLPGPTNMMGAVKFIFPNDLGVYLHDTPGRWAFARADRRLSSGCVRVERAADLYRWLFGRDLSAYRGMPEQRVPLRQPVPVYLFNFSPQGAAAIAQLT